MRTALRRSLIRFVPPRFHPHLRNLQSAATPLVGAALRRLPDSSRRFGPPRRLALSLGDYVERLRRDRRAVAEYRPLHDSETIRRRLPQSLADDIHFEFFNELARVSPAVGVAVLGNGRVLTRTGTVIGADDSMIFDVSETFFTDDPAAHPIFLAPKLPRVTSVPGSVAVLTTFRSDIYYHWIFDTLPRLQLLHESGVRCDRIVVPTQARFQGESLDLLGIERERVIAERGLHIEAERLVVPSLPGIVGNPPRWACDFLRRSFLPRLGQRGAGERRIYVARGKGATRRILNEEDLVRLLQKHGFEIVFPEALSFLQQVSLFDAASIIVGAHGSGLSNLVFCREGAHVVELFSPNYVTVPYWALSNQVGLDYHYVMGEGVVDRARGRGRQIHDDIRLDVSQVETVLRRIEDATAGVPPNAALAGG